MRKICLFLLVFPFLSCTQEQGNAIDLIMKQDACWKTIYHNEHTFAKIAQVYIEGGRRRNDSLIFAESEKFVSWRRTFIDDKSLENLMRYADAIEAEHEKRYGWQHVPVDELKQRVVDSGDSTDFYNLLYFAAVGESELLAAAAHKFGAGNYITWEIPSYPNKVVYQLSDTVYLTVPTAEVFRGTFQLDFSNVSCTLEGAATTIPPKIVKTGPYYIMMYRPTKSGVYKIGGEIMIAQEGNYRTVGRIRNKFTVAERSASPN